MFLRMAIAVAAAGAALLIAGPARAGMMYDFEYAFPTAAAPEGSDNGGLTVLSDYMEGISFLITRTSGSAFDVKDIHGNGPEGWGWRALSPFCADVDDWFLVNFSDPVRGVGIEMTDFGQDEDTAIVELFAGPDATGEMVGRATAFWGLGANPSMVAVSATAADGKSARSARFRGYSSWHPNGMYVDNLSIELMPEPATLAVLALGSAGLLLVRRRR